MTTIKLADILEKIDDVSKKIPKKNYLSAGKYPIISQDKDKFISGYTNEENPIKTFPLIIFGDHSCSLKYIDFPFFRGADGTQILYVNKKYNTKFIYYSILSVIKQIPNYKRYERHFKYLKEMPIPISANQDKIASILSLLDEKIETNAKIAKVLEYMMREIYNYWFVQFDFPDENGNPYKSSGGKMVWNEELNKEIPKEWKVKKLEDIFLFEKGTEVGSKEYKTEKTTNTIGFYRVQDMNSNSVSVFVNINNKLKIVEEKNVIVSFDGTVGKVDYGLNGAISSGLRHIYSPNQEYLNALVFNIFKDEKTLETIKKYATGSNILHASGSIKHLNISFNEKYIKEFQNIIEPFFNQMVKLKQQNQTLSNLRDFLLPLLMNGQAEVL